MINWTQTARTYFNLTYWFLKLHMWFRVKTVNLWVCQWYVFTIKTLIPVETDPQKIINHIVCYLNTKTMYAWQYVVLDNIERMTFTFGMYIQGLLFAEHWMTYIVNLFGGPHVKFPTKTWKTVQYVTKKLNTSSPVWYYENHVFPSVLVCNMALFSLLVWDLWIEIQERNSYQNTSIFVSTS